jgi:hypothetical protein
LGWALPHPTHQPPATAAIVMVMIAVVLSSAPSLSCSSK